MLKYYRQLATLVVLAFVLTSTQSQAKTSGTPTAEELTMLPDYCQARLGANIELRNLWNQRIGPEKFMHLHHYCHGLRYMNRAKFTLEKRQRRGYFQTAVAEFDYVIRSWPADFVLTVDAKKQKSQAESMLRLP